MTEKETYGLIGYPLGHSFSRAFFTEKFEKEGINAQYLNFPIEEAGQLLDIVRRTPGLKGLNCTIPHKQAIMPMMAELDPLAREIGAVNVVKVMPDGSLKGYNSDIVGFMESIRPLLKPHHRKALVLGTGGASKAVCVGLGRLGLEWTYVSRTAAEGRLTYDDLTREVMEEYTVVVNCSPVGMFPKVEGAPALPYASLTPRHLLYDLVYNPTETTFMRKGAERGAVTKNGLEMLHRQALESWRIWQQ